MKPKIRLFVKEYLIDRNATQAAIRAGYSEKTAGSIGSELLQKPEVSAAVQRGLVRLSKKLDLTAERVLQEMANIAFATPADVLSWQDGDLVLEDSDFITPEAMASIAEVTRNASGELKVKFHDKGGMLDKLAKHLGLYEADNLLKIKNLTNEQRAAVDQIDALLEASTPEEREVIKSVCKRAVSEAEEDASKA